MARRGGRRSKRITQPPNQIAAVIYGLRRNGDIARISAYQLKDGVRLSGPNFSKIVHGSNDDSIEGWKREAVLLWDLTDVYDAHPMFANSEHEKEKYAALEAKGAQRKRQLAEHQQKQKSGDA
jgi:hypothetical protein